MTRFDRAEGQGIVVRGVPVAVAWARGKQATLVVGGFDADNLLETEEEVNAAARRLGEKIDKSRRSRDNSG